MDKELFEEDIEKLALDNWNKEPYDFRDCSEFTDYKIGFIACYKAVLQSGLSINFAEEKEEKQNAEKGKVILKIKANESKVDMEKFGDLEKEFGENLE